MRIHVLDGGGPKDSENTLNSFLTKSEGNMFWQIGTDMFIWSTYFASKVAYDMMVFLSPFTAAPPSLTFSPISKPTAATKKQNKRSFYYYKYWTTYVIQPR